MASSVGMWALVVLSFLATSCISQDVYPDRYAVLYSSSSQLEYKTDKTGDQNVEKNEEVSVVGLGDKSSSTKGDEGMLVPNEKLLEVMEQPAIRKKAACVGCPTDIDVGIPNNREALLEMLRVSLPATDVESLFKNGPPNIVAAAKLIESGVRYSVTFETAGSPCSMIDEELFSEGCLPQQSLCIADILITIDGTQSAILRNCSSSPQGLAKNWESIENSDPLQDSTMNVEDIVAGDSVLGNEQGIDGTREALHISSVDYPQGIPSEHIRLKRSNDLSGLKDVDKSEWKLISQFAELAVKTLDEVDPDDMKQIILGVTEAKKQIVNGIMYHLVLKVGTSTCQEDAASLADSTCVQNELYPERICRVQIHRSWADESPLNAKVVKSECADVWPDDPLRELPSAERARRSNQDCWPSTDGWKTYDFKDGTQEDCFEKVMTSFQDVLNVKDVAKVATIRDAHTRMNKETMEPEMVVTIILADPEKLKMMGNIKKPMVVSSRVICSQRLKRSLPGGIIPGDVNDPKVINIAKFALPEIQNSINSPYQHSLFRIVDVGYQIVAGSLYHLKLEVAPTSCLKSDKSSEPCTSTDTEQLLICNLKVWDQPWTQKREVQDISCGASRSKREEHVLGGLEHVAADDPYVQELASFAVSEIDKSLNSPYQQKVLRVVEAKTQVVAGTLMYLKLELVTTNCLKSEMAGVGNCTHNPDQTSTMCSVKVWDQPWLKKREVQDVQCGRSRSKRDASSFEEQKFLPVDAKDPYIVEATSYALNELDKSTNTPYHHKILHIISAAIQHTEITKVRLLLNVGYSSCKKSSSGLSGSRDCDLLQGTSQKLCHVELMHEPLLQIRFVTRMDCSNSDQKNVHQHNDHLIGEDSLDAHSAMFREFIHRFNKTYSSDAELQKRFNIFRANLKLIAQLQEGEQGTATYGPTIFADLSPKEFKSRFLGLRPDLHQENAVPMRMADIPNINLPLSFDWRDHNAVTPVKNQGACGSCWAFAVTGNIEGQNAIKHGVLVPLSEQELVDCDTLDDGCKGGLPENAYHALESLGGIESESDYPYDGRDEQCHFNQSDVRVLIKSSVNITTSEHDMAKWLVKNGPIAIGINANAMQFYFGGVSHPFKFLCTPEDLDHGVLIVGYGVHTTSIRHKVLPYWLIKNSWGTFWGEKGYYRVYRGDGTCGVNQMASSAVIN